MGGRARAAGDEDTTRRVHFHVPVFCQGFGLLGSTQADLADLLASARVANAAQHYELETYTWDVIPEADRPGDRTEAIVRELSWTRDRLQ